MSKNDNNLYRNALTIPEFLCKYYGINNLGKRRMIHKNLHSLFPQIEMLTLEDVLKNQELFLTGQAVLVKDSDNNYVPYLTGCELEVTCNGLDQRENLIVELIIAIKRIIEQYQKGLIILENNDNINRNVIGKESQQIDITGEALYGLNNPGGILIRDPESIYTFQYLINQLSTINLACYSKNRENAVQISQDKDIISICIENGEIYIIYNGITTSKISMLEIRNFLLKHYYPKQQIEESDKEYICLDYLRDYEIEQLMRRFYREKNFDMHDILERELHKRHLNERDNGCKQYKRKKRYLRDNYHEEEE